MKLLLLGGSAGSLGVIARLLPTMAGWFDGAVACVVHGMGAAGDPQVGAWQGSLGGQFNLLRAPAAGLPLVAHALYSSLPDRHLMFQRQGEHVMVLSSPGPRVRRSRPSVDVMFRSAALLTHTERVGVLLSGYLDDGAAGLQRLAAAGVPVIVQSPTESFAADMPMAGLAAVPHARVAPPGQLSDAVHEAFADLARGR